MERNRMKNITDFTAILNNAGTEYRKRVVENIIDRSFDNKKTLLDMLEKFDTFESDNLRVSRKMTFHIEPEYSNARYQFQCMCEMFGLLNWGNDERPLYGNLMYAMESIDITETLKERFERVGCKCAIGQKLTRVVNKLFAERVKDLDESNVRRFNQLYANFCDYLKNKDVDYVVYFSVNPADYISMSHGNSWSSCHSLKNMGCHVGGCISLLLDDCTILAYASTDESIGSDKVFRLCLNHFHNVSMISSIYGGVDYETFRRGIFDEWKTMLEEIGNNVLNESPDEEHCYYRFEENSDNLAYPDYCYDNILTWFYGSYNESFEYYYIGGSATCLICGDELDDCENVICCGCNNRRECSHCGDMHVEDDMYWINVDWYCADCVVECHECGEMMVVNNEYSLGNYEYCHDCYMNLVERCSECGDEDKRDNMEYDEETDNYYCEYCYTKLIEEREEEYQKFCEENPDDDEDEEETA